MTIDDIDIKQTVQNIKKEFGICTFSVIDVAEHLGLKMPCKEEDLEKYTDLSKNFLLVIEELGLIDFQKEESYSTIRSKAFNLKFGTICDY